MSLLLEWPQWDGATVVVLAGGPSLTREQFELVGRAHAEGRCKAIAVNRAYELAPWADILYGHDARGFWGAYPAALEFQGLKLCGEGAPSGVYEIPTAKRTDAIKLGKVGHFYDSGFDALQIAALCGGRRILACGFDARPNGHWHEGYAKRQMEYEEIIPLHREWMHVLGERDTIVLNCSEGSAIDAYPPARLEDVL